MKIVLLSLSIGILGYFALQTLPLRDPNPQLGANSSDATTEESDPSKRAARVRGHH